MARVGGEADKLGNRYEGIWTVDSLISVLSGEAQGISIEPIDRALGVEFILHLNDGGKEFHSVKRQTTQMVWSMRQLTSCNEQGRSILGALVAKIMAHPTHRAAFISSTTANDLETLREAAHLASDAANFEARLQESGRLLGEARVNLLPLFNDLTTMWNVLLRMRVVGFTEPELIRRVDQRIRYTLYRPDGAPVDAEAVRLALGEAVLGWLGTEVTADKVQDYLAARGWRERDWQRDTILQESVRKRNRAYTELVEAELVHGTPIPRKEAADAIALLTGSNVDVAIIGAAGLGKSCAIAQIVHGLAAQSIPHLTLRLDVQTAVLTPEALGRELDLPMSPAMVLAGLSQGARSVLVIDQLDALSLVSGRNQHLWDVFEELLREARRYPQMRVLLACREFDAENDHRLKRLLATEAGCKRINLAPISISQVEESVRVARVDPAKLTAHDLALLQTPQNLSLFLQSGPEEHGQVGSVQALLTRYWDHKRRRVDDRLRRASRWMDVVRTLANWLSEHQTLSAPSDVLDEFAGDVEVMSSEHVIVFDGKKCRFFHESVFDYVFARIYVTQGGTAAKLLFQDEQHLFRRGQVRQILAYNRDRDFNSYLADLRLLVTDPAIRAHIKKVVIDWLRNVPYPNIEEWRVVQVAAAYPPASLWWRTVPHGSVGWFDLLVADGTWLAWLKSDENTAQHALWLIGQNPIMRHRSEKVAELIEPLLDGSKYDNERLRTLLRFCEPHHSRRMFDLFLRGVREGWLDDATDDWWHHLHDFPDKAPAHAVELLKAFLERQFARVPAGDPFPRRANKLHFPDDYCIRLAESAADSLLSEILPLVGVEITKRPVTGSGNRDALWQFIALGRLHNFGESLLEGLAQAAANLARDKPERYKAVSTEFLEMVSHSLAFILVRGWAGNPQAFADDCARYLAHDSSRLHIGYDISSGLGGHGPDYVTRMAIRKIAPHCNAAVYPLLESAILRFKRGYESPQHSGFAQMLLLATLPAERLGAAARSRLDELKRKFPEVSIDDARPPEPIQMQSVPSPIPPEAIAKMNTADWISAMRAYDSDRPRRGGPLKGGMHELGNALQLQVRTERNRFAKMILELPNDINPAYFDDILNGLTQDDRGDIPKNDSSPPVSMDALTLALQKAHALPGRPSGRAICHAIGASAKAGPTDELLAMLSDYAMNDPDPQPEDWSPRADGRVLKHGGDPLFSGINSVRGAATWEIGKVLFANPALWPKLEAAVRSVVNDPSISVRACGVHALLPVLNFDRALAVELFLQLVEGADAVLGTSEIDNFIHHGIYPHYKELRPLLMRMLRDPNKEVRATAAGQIAVASLDGVRGGEDLEQALAAGSECRAASAGVYAFNLRAASVRDICREKLAGFFDDSEKAVRDEAASCFRGLDDEILTAETGLIDAYIKSAAFADGATQLMYALDDATTLLPDVVCGIPERLIELHAASGADVRQRHDTYRLPELVMRLYRQTSDHAIRRRCLDTIDRMLAYGIGDIDSALGKVER